jgi:glutathione S-transferase
MLQVYLDPCTVNSRKVLAGLDLIGLPFELKHVDYFSGEHKKPEFLAINPNGAVPAVVDGGLALSESNAILQYAADLSRSEKYYPKDLKQRADINRWLLWEASTWFPSCYTYLVEYVVKPLLQTEPDETVIGKEAPNWHRLAGILDARLAQSKWLAGDTVTIADIAVASPMHIYKWQRLPLGDHPNLKRWMAAVEQLPCWQKTQGAVEQALQLK